MIRPLAGVSTVAALVFLAIPCRAQLGSPTGDLVYTPLAPCRVLDTRSTSQVGPIVGPLTPATTYFLDIANHCGLPVAAATKAIVLNIVAVDPAGKGNLQVWPWDNTSPGPPTSSVINYGNTAGFNIANGLVVPSCNTATATGANCNHDVFLMANFAATQVVIDVLGFFAVPHITAMECTSVQNTFSAIANSSTLANSPACPATYALTGGGVSLQGQIRLTMMRTERDTNDDSKWACRVHNEDPTDDFDAICEAVCCRVPGR